MQYRAPKKLMESSRTHHHPCQLWGMTIALLIGAFAFSPLTVIYLYQRFRSAYLPSGVTVFRNDDCAFQHEQHNVTASVTVGVGGSINGPPQMCRAHPLCMKDWVMAGHDEVMNKLQQRKYLVLREVAMLVTNDAGGVGTKKTSSSRNSSVRRLLSEQNEPPSIDGFTRAAVSITHDAQLLPYMQHIPHFSEAYFNFFSIALWSCSDHYLQQQVEQQRLHAEVTKQQQQELRAHKK